MVVILKREVHSCPVTNMLYAYPARICQYCQGKGIDFHMTTEEMFKENIRRQFEKKLNSS